MTPPFDISIINFFQSHLQCGFLDVFFKIFTYLGEMGIVWIVTGIIMLFFKTTRKTGLMVLVGLLIGVLIGNLFLKNVIARPRPFQELTDITLKISKPSGYSFPSGHTLSSFISAIIILINHKKIGTISLVVAFIIAISRIYFAVHYLTDILGGIVLGVTIALLVTISFKLISKGKN